MARKDRAKHELVIEDRNEGAAPGVRHYHRWVPTCPPCSWRGQFKHTTPEVEAAYREHVRSVERREVSNRRRLRRAGGKRNTADVRSMVGPQPRPVTPLDQLPPELR